MYTDLLYFNWMFIRPLCIRAQYDQYQVTVAAFLLCSPGDDDDVMLVTTQLSSSTTDAGID